MTLVPSRLPPTDPAIHPARLSHEKSVLIFHISLVLTLCGTYFVQESVLGLAVAMGRTLVRKRLL
jgi:hypothetical protein